VILFPQLRPQGDYTRSLTLLKTSKDIDPTILTKSGFMVGLGETPSQITQLMKDLRDAQVDILTIGQYLQPTPQHAPVQTYYSPEMFDRFKQQALSMGFLHVESGPLVRSSYHAEQAVHLRKMRGTM
jgi:lipoic acid synthetase